MSNYNTEFQKHREAHLAYWKAKNVECDMARYDDGFPKGWEDAGHTANWTDQFNMRKEEHIKCHGDSDHVWEFEHGYKEAFETYRKGLEEGKAKYKEEEREVLLIKFREQHCDYHKSRGTAVKLEIYEAGWRAGWIDKIEGCHGGERRGHGKDQYVREHGCAEFSWEYETAYDEAGRECK